MEVDPQDPVSSKGLLDVNLPSVITLKKGFEGKTPLGSPLSRLGAAPRGVLRSWRACVSQTQQHRLRSRSLQTMPCPGRGCHPGNRVEVGLGKEKARACGFAPACRRSSCPLLRGRVRQWWPWLSSAGRAGRKSDALGSLVGTLRPRKPLGESR